MLSLGSLVGAVEKGFAFRHRPSSRCHVARRSYNRDIIVLRRYLATYASALHVQHCSV